MWPCWKIHRWWRSKIWRGTRSQKPFCPRRSQARYQVRKIDDVRFLKGPSSFRGDEVRHLRLAIYVEPPHGFLDHTVGVGDALMLAKMLHPGFQQERLDEAPRLGGVLEYAPGVSAVAAPSLFEFCYCIEEGFAIGRPDAVFDRHQDRPAVVPDTLHRDRRRPLHRRCKVDACSGLQFPLRGQHDGCDRTRGSEKERNR